MFRTPRCVLCGSADLTLPRAADRDPIVCRGCLGTTSAAALGRVILERLARSGETSLAELARRRLDLRVYAFGAELGVTSILRGQPWFGAPEPGAPDLWNTDLPCSTAGVDARGVDSTGFDLVIGPGIPDTAVRLAAIARMLRPGGSYLCLASEVLSHERSNDAAAMFEDAGLRLVSHAIPTRNGTPSFVYCVMEARKPIAGRPFEPADVVHGGP